MNKINNIINGGFILFLIYLSFVDLFMLKLISHVFLYMNIELAIGHILRKFESCSPLNVLKHINRIPVWEKASSFYYSDIFHLSKLPFFLFPLIFHFLCLVCNLFLFWAQILFGTPYERNSPITSRMSYWVCTVNIINRLRLNRTVPSILLSKNLFDITASCCFF